MTAAKAPTIAFVIPCYNEQVGIQHTLTCLLADLDKLEKSKAVSPKSYVLLVDDGSTDRTWALIERASHKYPKRVRGLKLSRNVGHQNALLAGLLEQVGKSDAVISLDADLQDDMSVVAEMIEHFNNGTEIVFAVRKRRNSDSRFKRGTADLYYRTLNWLGADIIPHHSDFRYRGDRRICRENIFRGQIAPALYCRARNRRSGGKARSRHDSQSDRGSATVENWVFARNTLIGYGGVTTRPHISAQQSANGYRRSPPTALCRRHCLWCVCSSGYAYSAHRVRHWARLRIARQCHRQQAAIYFGHGLVGYRRCRLRRPPRLRAPPHFRRVLDANLPFA